MKPILIIIIFFLTNDHVFGQRELTMIEILRNWNLERNSNVIVNSSSTLNNRLTKLADSLQLEKVDSLIIFSTALPGYSSTSKCDTGIFPITSFIIWCKDNITHIKKIRGNCSSENNVDSLSYLFNVSNEDYQKMDSEFFMPVILSGWMYKNKTVSYSMSWVDHEPNYSFYYRIGGKGKSFQFCQSYFDNRESLFRDYNLNLHTYYWWRLVKQAVDKIDQ